MLTAYYKGKKIIASEQTIRGKEYICPNPDCNYPYLILKKGKVKIPHFAHKKRSGICEPEPESRDHIIMKKLIADNLEISADFIEYYGFKGVVPDVYDQRRGIVFECQRSPITVEEIQRRNNIYLKLDIIPLWIFWGTGLYWEEGREMCNRVMKDTDSQTETLWYGEKFFHHKEVSVEDSFSTNKKTVYLPEHCRI